jgi:hypothetical protein
VTGQIGGAFNFDGASQRVSLPNVAVLDLSTAAKSSWTIAAWVRPTIVSGTQWPVVYMYGFFGASANLSDDTAGSDGRLEHWRNNTTMLIGTTVAPLNTWTRCGGARWLDDPALRERGPKWFGFLRHHQLEQRRLLDWRQCGRPKQ